MLYSKRILISLGAGAVAVAAWAYTISGIVTDEAGEPLADATVRVLAARDSAFVAGGVADGNGR